MSSPSSPLEFLSQGLPGLGAGKNLKCDPHETIMWWSSEAYVEVSGKYALEAAQVLSSKGFV